MPLPLADAIYWLAVVCCVVAQAVIVRGALRASATRSASGTGHKAVPPARRWLEVVWAVVPAVALAAVLAATWRAIHPA